MHCNFETFPSLKEMAEDLHQMGQEVPEKYRQYYDAFHHVSNMLRNSPGSGRPLDGLPLTAQLHMFVMMCMIGDVDPDMGSVFEKFKAKQEASELLKKAVGMEKGEQADETKNPIPFEQIGDKYPNTVFKETPEGFIPFPVQPEVMELIRKMTTDNGKLHNQLELSKLEEVRTQGFKNLAERAITAIQAMAVSTSQLDLLAELQTTFSILNKK